MSDSLLPLDELLETEHDRRAFDGAARAIGSGQALALVGAGFSARAGYPAWNELLDALASRVQERAAQRARGRGRSADGVARKPDRPASARTESLDVLWRAEELRELMGEDEYRLMLGRVFGADPRSDDALDLLALLPFRHVLTTNYDRSIEAAFERMGGDVDPINWSDEQDVLRLLYGLLETSAPRRVVHLHGHVARPETVVLSDRDYVRQYLRTDSTVRKLFALFSMRRFVFFGFSLQDPDLTAILRQVAGAFGHPESRHFAFIGVDPEVHHGIDRKRLARKFGIDAIFYDRADRHARLVWLMRHLVARCLPASDVREITSAATAKMANVPPAPAMPGGERAITDAPPSLVGTTATPAPGGRVPRMNPRVPDDPRKGMFGGQPAANGRVMSAVVTPLADDPALFDVQLTVRAESGAPPLAGRVRFYLHDTFDIPVMERTVHRGAARLALISYGAFTVGAVADGGATELELDLATLPDAPKRFRDS